MDGRNVVLTGFMGTGKTTVGRLLAEELDYEFVDTDAVIVDRHGPIPMLFAEHGEARFRELEREVAAELAARERTVVATGGRLLLDPVNAAMLARTGRVVCLTASLDTILTRVGADGAAAERPMLAGDDVRRRIEALLDERRDAYARFDQVDTDGRTPAEVVVAVVALLDR